VGIGGSIANLLPGSGDVTKMVVTVPAFPWEICGNLAKKMILGRTKSS